MLLSLALLCLLPLLTGAAPSFHYYNNSACANPSENANLQKEMDFAVQYPPYDGACHSRQGSIVADVPYTLHVTNSSSGAYFRFEMYNDLPETCDADKLAIVLTATSTTSQIACTQGSYWRNVSGALTNGTLWFTIDVSGGGAIAASSSSSGSASGASGGASGSSSTGSGDDSSSSSLLMYAVIAVVAVLVIGAVAGGVYWYMKRSKAAREGEAGEDAGQYSTIA